MIDDITLPDTLSYSNEELYNFIKKESPEWENTERKVCLEKIKELCPWFNNFYFIKVIKYMYWCSYLLTFFYKS